MAKAPPLFTDRFELCRLLELSMQALVRNEKNLGIEQFKFYKNARVIRYHRAETFAALKAKGFVVPDP